MQKCFQTVFCALDLQSKTFLLNKVSEHEGIFRNF